MRALNAAGEDILPSAKKTKALLAYLCLSRGARVSRSSIAGLLWDRSAEARARDHLRHALSELNNAGGAWQLERERHWVRLNTQDCWIDVFENSDTADLLDDLTDVSPAFDRWLLEERARFETEAKIRLERELDLLLESCARPQLRINAARKLLRMAPEHEKALRALMAGLVDNGTPTQALLEYEAFKALLQGSHGMRPAEKTEDLYEDIRQKWESGPRGKPALMPFGGSARSRSFDEASLLPSIAVLPFRNLSTKRDYVAEGITEDLIETLSRVSSLFVISRLSTASFKRQEKSPQEIGAALGSRYILSGSVRYAGNRLRLNVELTDTANGGNLWADRYDRRFSDLLDIQDQLVDTIFRSIAPHVRLAELKRVRTIKLEDLGAYQLLIRAQECMHQPSREAFEEAEGLFDRAIKRDPNYTPALTWRAYWHVMRVGQEWSPSPAEDSKQAERFASRACLCDPSDPMAIAVQGHIAGYLYKDFDRAFESFERALEINPNSSRAWLWSSNARAWTGDGADAVRRIERATALSPYDPLRCAYSGGAAMAHLANGQYAKAAEFARRCIRDNPCYTTGHKLLIIALSMQGIVDEARCATKRMLLLEPGFTVERYRRRFPGSEGPLADPFCDALARAGIPRSDT